MLYFKLVSTRPLQAEGYFYCIYFQCLCFQRSFSCFIFNYFMCSQILLIVFPVCISYCFLYSPLLANFSNLGASVISISLLFISKWFMVILKASVFALSHQGSVLCYLRLVRYFRKCLSCGLPCHLCRGRNRKNVNQILHWIIYSQSELRCDECKLVTFCLRMPWIVFLPKCQYFIPCILRSIYKINDTFWTQKNLKMSNTRTIFCSWLHSVAIAQL